MKRWSWTYSVADLRFVFNTLIMMFAAVFSELLVLLVTPLHTNQLMFLQQTLMSV